MKIGPVIDALGAVGYFANCVQWLGASFGLWERPDTAAWFVGVSFLAAAYFCILSFQTQGKRRAP